MTTTGPKPLRLAHFEGIETSSPSNPSHKLRRRRPERFGSEIIKGALVGVLLALLALAAGTLISL